MNYAVIDLASLAWLLPELDGTIKLARTHLAKAAQTNDCLNHLSLARRAIHDASGALKVIDARGVIHFLDHIEKAIKHCAELSSLDKHAFTVLDEACFAVTAYLHELHSTGVLLQPVVLFAEYEAVCLLNPAQNLSSSCHPADLYFPGLNPRLPRVEDSSAKQMPAQINLQKIRNAYENLLLLVFKKTATPKDLSHLSLLLGMIAGNTSQAHAYSFWTTCQAVTQTLHQPSATLELGQKRWLGRLNLQIQRLAAGSDALSERLFREALFYIAVSQASQSSNQALHSSIAKAYSLEGSVPIDWKMRRYGQISPANPTALLDKLNSFKLAWDEAAPAPTEAEGIEVSEGMLLRRLRIALQLALDLQLSLSEHHLGTLMGVAQSLAQATTLVSESGKPLHNSLGLEGAKAILWIEQALKSPGQTHANLTQQAQVLIDRINQSKSSDIALPEGPDLSGTSTQLLMGDVIREVMVTLSTVEKQLDDHFRFDQNPANIQSTLAPLAQSSSAVNLLGLPQVANAIKAVEHRINGFITQPTSANQSAYSSFAVQFSQITSALDLFTHSPERAQTDYVFDPIVGELTNTRALPKPADDGHTFDSVESLSVKRRADAQVLIKKIVEKPQDVDARQALLESIQTLKDDAALTGDLGLSELSNLNLTVDLNHHLALTSNSPLLNIAPEQAVDPTKSSKDAQVLAQLDAMLSEPIIASPTRLPVARSEDDLYGIFLEEARGVLSDAEQLLHDLEAKPSAMPVLTDLRRSFHTLKGSSRMVGFKAFGDAAWHVEQVVNAALSRQTPASIDLIQFMRCGQEQLSVWLTQLDDILLGMDLEALSDGDSPSFAVNSTVAGFTSQLAPYLQAIERGLERKTPIDAFESALNPLSLSTVGSQLPEVKSHLIEPAPQALASNNAPLFLTQVNEVQASSPPHIAENETQTVQTVLPRPKISLVANNEGLRPQDFIDKARNAVMQAQARELNQPLAPKENVVLQPVQITSSATSIPPAPLQDTMVSIGPLRLPKPLFAIYIQETKQHIDALKADLAACLSEPDRASHNDAYMHAHSLRGSAATIGLGPIKDISAALEAVFQTSMQAALMINRNDLAILAQSIAALDSAFNDFSENQYPPVQVETIHALADLQAQLLARSKAPTLPPQGPPQLLAIQAEQSQPFSVNVVLTEQATEPQTATPFDSGFTPSRLLEMPIDTPNPGNTASSFNDEPNLAASLLALEDTIQDEIEADIWPEFVIEADQILPKAQASLVALPNDARALNDVRRDLHTLKGSSRMAGAMRMGALVHAMESKLEKNVQAQAPFLSLAAHNELLDDYEDMYALYEALKNPTSISRMTAPQPLPVAMPAIPATPAATPAAIPSMPVTAPYLNMMAQASALFDDALSTPTNSLASNAPAAFVKIDEPKIVATHSQSDDGAINPNLNITVAAPSLAPQLTALAALAPLAPLAPLVAVPVSRPIQPSTQSTSAAPANPPESALALPALRMRTDLLDHLVNQASEMSSSKGRMDQHVLQLRASLRELTDNVDRLRKQLREIEIQAESQMATRTELSTSTDAQFDPLEFDRFTRFQELTRMLTESLNDMLSVRDSVAKTLMDAERELLIQSKAGKDLTQSLMRSRLVAFDVVSDRLYRVVRQTARELAKQVTLDIQGGHLTLDRSILERITSGLEHLVRNSVVHGIEPSQQRSIQGKSTQGTITIQVKQQGNELEINLTDDGAGLALERIRDKAIAKGMLSTQSLPTVQQLSEFIFAPGFSTADTVTELAGRGIGMDVVRSDIVSLGGRITLSTAPQQNTRFSIRIPLTLAINQVLMVIAQDVQYAIPTSLIQTVVSIKPSDLAQAYSNHQIIQRASKYPFAHLAQLLQLPYDALEHSRAASVILLSNGSDTVAIHVDQVLGNQETVVKPISTAIMRVPGLSSATLLNDGQLCLILDPVQLWVSQNNVLETLATQSNTAFESAVPAVVLGSTAPSHYTLGSQRLTVDPAPAAMVQVVSTQMAPVIQTTMPERLRKWVMVVDDSLTVRKVTEKLLKREGWEVLLAKDGIDALEQLQANKPSVMLVDIEMPRMDGFDLTRNIRADDKLKAIPIIMITSRIADKHRDHAFSLGVNAYMGKPYRDDELLAEMIKLTTVSTAPSLVV